MCCFLSPCDKPTWHSTNKYGSLKEGIGQKDEHAVKNQKVVMPTVKLKLNVNEVIEDIADHVDRAAISKTQDTQPGELREGEFIDINEENDFDIKEEDVPE